MKTSKRKVLRFNVARDTRKYSMCTVLGVLFNGEMLTDTFFFFFHFYSRSSHLVEWKYTNQAFQCQSVPAGNCSNWFPLSRTSIKLSIVRRAGGIIWEGRKPLVNTAWGLSWRVPCTTKQIYDSGNLSTLTDFIWLLHGDSVLVKSEGQEFLKRYVTVGRSNKTQIKHGYVFCYSWKIKQDVPRWCPLCNDKK